jgi:hypothetical protein
VFPQVELIKFLKIQDASQKGNTLSAEDLKFIRIFWSRLARLTYHWPNSFAEKILPICVQMVGLLPILDTEIVAGVGKKLELELQNLNSRLEKSLFRFVCGLYAGRIYICVPVRMYSHVPCPMPFKGRNHTFMLFLDQHFTLFRMVHFVFL